MNAATDNPMVFAETGELLSGGNFHGQPVAIAADLLAIAGGRARRHQRAAHRAARQPGALRPARVPRARGRAPLGPHDGPRHRRGPRLREQGRSPTPRASTRSRPRPARKTTSRWARPRPGRPRASWRTPRACWRSSCSSRARRSTSAGRCARRRRSKRVHAARAHARPGARPRPHALARDRGARPSSRVGRRPGRRRGRLRHVGVAMTSEARTVRAPRGTTLSCRSWQQEAALRMLMNNLDPEVAERPQDLVVYGGHRQGGAQLGVLRRHRARAARARATTRRCSSSRESPSGSSARTRTRRAC